MILDLIEDYIVPFCDKHGGVIEGGTINLLSNGGTIANYPGGRYRTIIVFAVDANLDPGEEVNLMVGTQQSRREIEPMCIGGLMSVKVERRISIQGRGETNRVVRTIHGVAGRIEMAMPNGQMKPPYPSWIAFHPDTKSMVIQSQDAEGKLLAIQTVCLDDEGHGRLSRTAANEVMQDYYDKVGGKGFFSFAYDGNHRMLH
jgi:hypothetical protein